MAECGIPDWALIYMEDRHLLDEDVIRRTLGTALKRGGDFAEVFVEEKTSSSASLDDGRVEEVSS